MRFYRYLSTKFERTNILDILEQAFIYIGGDVVVDGNQEWGYKLVDRWFASAISRWRIEISYIDLKGSKLMAKLIPYSDGFEIKLNKYTFGVQRRFVFAHELAHLIFYDKQYGEYKRGIDHGWMEEKFCDVLARFILIPNHAIISHPINLNAFDKTSLDNLNMLWREYKVAPFQIIKRFHELDATQEVICIHWLYEHENRILRIVDYSSSKRVFIPKEKRAYLWDSLNKPLVNYTPGKALQKGEIISEIDVVLLGSIYKENLHSTTFAVQTKRNNKDYNINVFQIVNIKKSYSILEELMVE